MLDINLSVCNELVSCQSRKSVFKKLGLTMQTPINGTTNRDTIYASSGDDIVFSLEENDKIFGGDGVDFLFGGDGSDFIRGGNGDDVLYGGDQNDNLLGDNGNDTLYAGQNGSGRDDKMRGGNGNDTYIIGSDSEDVVIFAEKANSGDTDLVVFEGQNFSDHLDVSFDSQGTFVYRRYNDLGDLNYFKIKDYDFVEFIEFNGVRYSNVQLAAKVNGVSDLTARYQLGTSGADTLIGTSDDDVLEGGAGRDNLVGHAGDDILNAGTNVLSQFESMQGRDGNDTYIIGADAGNILIRSETSGVSDRVIFEGLSTADLTSVQVVPAPNDSLEVRILITNSLGQNVQYRIRDYHEIESFTFTDRTLTIDEFDEMITPMADSAFDPLTIIFDALSKYFTAPLNASHENTANAQTTEIVYASGADQGEAFQFDHTFLAPIFAITQFDDPLDRLRANQFTNGADVFAGTSGDDNFSNLDSGSDVVRGLGGDDSLFGSNGYDVLFGDDGDDYIDGENYGDLIFGGDGNDWLVSSAGQDVLFGGTGDDVLISSLAMEYVDGGDGNDIIVSRSDGGEPIARVDGGDVSLVVPSLPNVQDGSGALSNDDLYGGAGNDTFVFEFTIGASNRISDLFADGTGIDKNSIIDWAFVAGQNDYRHQHWMDGIGHDFIHDFEVGADKIAFVGHTVQIWDVTYDDVDQNGELDTIIQVYSDHKDAAGNSLSHDGDDLGTVTVLNAVLTTDELGVFDIPVHHHAGMMPTLQGQIDPNEWGDLLDYTNRAFVDSTGAPLMGSALVNEFGSFESIRLFGAYYNIDSAAIRELQTNASGEQRASWLGTSASDVFDIPELGMYVDAGAGDDIIRGWDHAIDTNEKKATLLASDNIFGGAGDDNIYGGQLDDHLFGGSGNDVILGGGRHRDKSLGDNDIIFGGDGNDVLDGGMDQDVLFGGAGDDRIIAASEMQETEGDFYTVDTVNNFRFGGDFFDLEEGVAGFAFRQPRDPRTTNDILFGGEGADSFEFKVLDAKVGTDANYELIHVTGGVDTIADFDVAAGDTLTFNIRGTAADFAVAFDDVLVDGDIATVISLISDTTDNLATHQNNVASGVDYIETDHTGSVSEVIVLGHSSSEIIGVTTMDYRDEVIFVSDHYADYLA